MMYLLKDHNADRDFNYLDLILTIQIFSWCKDEMTDFI